MSLSEVAGARSRGCLAAFLMLVATACAAPQASRVVDSPGLLPQRIELASVPFFPQVEDYCGPAALAMALNWSGLDETPDSLVSQVYTPGREGTLAPDILSAARRKGRLAVKLEGLQNVLGEVAAGNPVLVFQNLGLDWWPQWHFAVLIGYDLDSRQVILHSGTSARLVAPLDAFERTWGRSGYWALVVLPPDRLPAQEDRRAILLAAAGLEQAGELEAAATAYRTIVDRWPAETVAWIGLGNARFALGRFVPAESAFRVAITRSPGSAQAWNNLAYALSRLGRREEAIAAARKAVALAGDDDANYRSTLEEVSAR